MFKKLKSLLFVIILSVIYANYVDAQTTGNTQNTNNQSTDLGGFYYIDQLGSFVSDGNFRADGIVDVTKYVLGAGDLVTVTIDANQKYVFRALFVNAQGDIIIPSFGSVPVGGLSIENATKVVEDFANTAFKSAKVSLSLEIPKSVSVHVTGSVPYPGKQTILPFTRVDEAVYFSIFENEVEQLRPEEIANQSRKLLGEETYISARPTDYVNRKKEELSNSQSQFKTNKLLDNRAYSLRNITITHRDSSESSADLIAYFKAGRLDKNPLVKDGDVLSVIRINVETPKISISGAVRSPLEMEYVVGDSPSLLLAIGGGFEEAAESSKLVIFRAQGSGLEKIEVLKENWHSFTLLPNDRVVALYDTSLQNQESASAWVYGEVKIPGNFPITVGETTAYDLIQYSEGLTEKALPHAAYLVRGQLKRNEIPNKFNVELMQRTSDQVVQGLEYLSLETNLSQDKVFIDLTDSDQLKSIKLSAGDKIYIPRDENTIFVFGQVNNPGYLPYQEEVQNVSEYIQKSGGFALSADLDRVFIIKAGGSSWYRANETKLESGDRIYVDRTPLEELTSKRQFEIQRAQLRNQRTQLIIAGIGTVTSIITAYVAITR